MRERHVKPRSAALPRLRPFAPSLTRRRFAVGLLGGVAGVLAGCRGSADASPGGSTAGGGRTGSGTGTACTLYPQQMEGPFYLDLALLRRDITEGRPGAPLTLSLQVLNASSCAALAGLLVDVWHCDAAGVYSGYAGQVGGVDTRGRKFLRGSQVTDAEGRVTFETIYPGWYPGRTTHIHFKVHLGSTSEATSQLYFPEEVTSAVYAVAPYAAHGQKDTSNASDGVARSALPPLATVTPRSSGGYIAALVIGVAR